MKNSKRLLILLIPLIFTACLKPKGQDNTASEEQAEIEKEKPAEVKYKYIPSAIITPEAWYAVESDEEGVLTWKSRFIQFDELIFLGVEKNWTYKNSSGKTGEGLFYLCEIEEENEKKQVWFFYNKIRQNSEQGVVIEQGFLYEEDDIMSILAEEVNKTDLLIVDTEYSNDTFIKVRIPSISESKDFYLEKELVSTQPMDLKVIEILKKADSFGEGDDKVKRKLLLTTVDKLGGSALIDLVVEEINRLDAEELENEIVLEESSNPETDEDPMDEEM